jgi:hypothetical protein
MVADSRDESERARRAKNLRLERSCGTDSESSGGARRREKTLKKRRAENRLRRWGPEDDDGRDCSEDYQ